MSKQRTDVDPNDCWNVESMYPTVDAWETHFNAVKGEDCDGPRWPAIASYRGKLGEGATTLKEALEAVLDMGRQLEKLYVYAHLRKDEDVTHDLHQQLDQRIAGLYHQFATEVSWFDPELLSLSEETHQQYLSAPELANYHFYLEKIFRLKAHTLSPEQEQLVAMAGQALGTAGKAFRAINDGDFSFGIASDSEGNEHELTHGSYDLLTRSHDRTLRENAFKGMLGKYRSYENTLCELLQGSAQTHKYNAQSHRHKTCLDAALFPKNIDTAVYHNLVSTVRDNLHHAHRYGALRKKILGVDSLHLYDMKVPLLPEVDFNMSWDEAVDVVIESVAPLGAEYQAALAKGLREERWCDRYENKGKRSGAYSSGCYDSVPYILMNYNGSLRNVFTLAHEAGHSMHSLLSKQNQPYHYADYSIFLAEVASTTNEQLLVDLLMKREKDPMVRMALLDQQIEDIRSTLLRQTMFAEFELYVHTLVEQNKPVTPGILREAYHKMNGEYFGDSVVNDEEISIEWARIPHFYYNFYVYQYATGISAAITLARGILNGGDKERDAYLGFLKGGCSKYPLDQLTDAGVDMRKPEAVQVALQEFGRLCDELESAWEGSVATS